MSESQVLVDSQKFNIDDDIFLNATTNLSDAEFVQAVYCIYVKRWVESPESISELVMILQEYKTRQEFITRFIRPSQEFQSLCQWWASASKDDIYWSLGISFARQGKRYEAITAYRQVLAPNSKSENFYGQLEQIKNIPQLQLEEFPPNDEAFLELTGDLSDAKFVQAVYSAYVKRSVDSSEGITELVRILHEHQTRKQFITGFIRPSEEFQSLCQFFQSATTSEIQGRLASWYAQEGKWDEAIAGFHWALTLKPDLVQAYCCWADSCARQNRSDEKVKFVSTFLKALLLHPDSEDVYLSFGKLLAPGKDLDSEMQVYRQSLLIEQILGQAVVLALQDNLEQALDYLQDENCKIKIDEVLHPQNHSSLDDPWLYSYILTRFMKKLFHQGKLKQAYICEKKAQPVAAPKGFYATTKEWALASNSKSHYIEIHPPHSPNITTIAKTIDREIHPNLTGDYWLKFDCPETFIGILPEGRYYQFGVYNTAVITSENDLLLDVSQLPGCPKEVKPLIFLGKNIPICKEIEGTVVVFTSNPGTNFYHYMFDFLPMFGLLEVSGLDLDRIDYFLLNFYPFDFYKETLEILGIPPKKIMTIQKYPHVKAKTLIVPSLPGAVCFPTKWSVEFLRRKFMPLIDDQITSELPCRVYISRNLGSKRRIVNEDEVLELLNKLGFITVYFEKMSMLEKVALMSRAEVVIGLCGAGLTNLVFANPGTKVIEIFPPNYIHFTYYILCHQLGLEYYYLVGDRFEIDYLAELIYKGGIGEDVIVNINSIRDILELAGIK
ncbi:MAG: hypothetical protein AUK43_15090 [Oscillatoriales cyanobacterium CG2_30_40_61]|nr:MAG: hypothetical protein AUK43_15090 [Oscillatoriales cyanobacterium CG2_30_40_61]